MNFKNELICNLKRVLSEIETGDNDIPQRIKDDIAILSAMINDSVKKHTVYKTGIKIKGVTYIYIGYTSTSLSTRMSSARSKRSGDTGLNKILRKNKINNQNFSEYEMFQETISSFWLEKQALEREKEEIKKACLDESVIVLNEKGVSREYKAKYHRK